MKIISRDAIMGRFVVGLRSFMGMELRGRGMYQDSTYYIGGTYNGSCPVNGLLNFAI